MNGRNGKMELLGKTPIPKALLAMGLPTMIGMMINALYNLVDAYFVGGLGSSQMGAISVVFPLGQAVVGLGLLFGNGAASYISRLLGRGDRETGGRAASTALYSSLLAGAALIIGTILFLSPVLKLLGATESILPYAETYAGIYMVFSIFNVFNVTMNNLVTSEGAAKTTMLALLAGAMLNILLDPVFIYLLDLGVAGAAIATAISQIVSASVYLCYILRKKSLFRFSVRECCFSKEIFSEIFKIGVPTLVFQLLISLAVALINMEAKEYGDSMIAAMGAVTRIISMGSLMVFGFIKGFQPIAGYSYGAGDYGRLKKAIKTAVLWSSLFCIAFGCIAALLSEPIISGFAADDAEMVNFGQNALRANGLSFMLFGFYTVYSSLFLALGKGRAGFILGALRQGICFVPVILILPGLWGANGILYAQPAADVLSAGITVFMAVGLHKELVADKFAGCENMEEVHKAIEEVREMAKKEKPAE
ncbi:MATE family efflux transporter [Anaerovorax odorimutans]|uniref:Multidrug export protein MepA n=1 Tax=Anaerovorax odorimutans TaxID=109327 RepID=A0ABT1RNR8_9FIRM|nr:MATE family efflux transporter [Anaerovorax odorimutans]MCQ4636566.1 MATE family efflux transporter [Anaerovorax odorimutans]